MVESSNSILRNEFVRGCRIAAASINTCGGQRNDENKKKMYGVFLHDAAVDDYCSFPDNGKR